tara:strand:+ start:3828 stop:4013 length:186 start_codon:yes stop_codon:yes gene_type:complete
MKNITSKFATQTKIGYVLSLGEDTFDIPLATKLLSINGVTDSKNIKKIFTTNARSMFILYI